MFEKIYTYNCCRIRLWKNKNKRNSTVPVVRCICHRKLVVNSSGRADNFRLHKSISIKFSFRFFIFPLIAAASWDEWVTENRVLKFNDANVQRQKELTKQYSAKNKKGNLNWIQIYRFFLAAERWKDKNWGIFFLFLFECSLRAVPATKPKKPDASGKDSDSRASTPSKEVTPAVEKPSATNLNTSSSTSRSRAPKPASATSVTSTPNAEQNAPRELKRGASERDSRDEGPKYVFYSNDSSFFLFQTFSFCCMKTYYVI